MDMVSRGAQNASCDMSMCIFPIASLVRPAISHPASQPAGRPAGGLKSKPASQRGSQAGGPKTTANEINECNE